MPVPLLIISDDPTSGSGFGRITRDLAVRIKRWLPEIFRVATLGYGGSYTRSLPFPQYTIQMEDWVIHNLPEIWQDFAGSEPGIVLTIWDASRLLWFARPETCEDPRLKQFLLKPPFRRWGYFPIDATGPNEKLTSILKHTIEGYDRALAYSAWGAEIVDRSFGKVFCEHRPHGMDQQTFFPRNRIAARHGFGQRLAARYRTNKGETKFFSVPDDSFMVGIVATNQMRKDYGLGIATVAELAEERNVNIWIHTDALERFWSLPALLNDFGLLAKAVVTTVPLSDEQLAWSYSACDVTLGIGLGEGFGYPIFESLACGAPCIHGNYGGAPEYMPESMLVEPVAWRLEGSFNCLRPVFDPVDFAAACKRPHNAVLPERLNWDNLWPEWSDWLARGLK